MAEIIVVLDDNEDVLDRVLQEADQEDAIALNEDLVEVEVAMLRCMVCPDETFTSEFWLLNHLRTHRPYYPTCNLCPRTFWHADSLARHADLHRRKTNWERRRILALCLYAPHYGYHHVANMEDHLVSVFGNSDLVRTFVMPFL